ncbi:MAG TPA: RagB/SusD family nutrient uptake outer membrane protein [Pedobacter sp.]|uniref:RagB/SusD family nutrient uptake outer membrane protein n=1 Tax=Pedobacter sp. TaxID=1411316 RepID=UPI002CA674BB|nr:RagB/SusD family nutrient uptake outer membrane protein [Pedobacter sp.]HMI05439.1 RagB/SusD family nutrient uptake outer membrane protein [Pedobacter sp.]
MKTKTTLIIILLFSVCSCKKYLDVVPDNVATIENAFTMRNTAEKFLFTCYSYIPKNGDYIYDPAVMGADEMWGLQTEWAALRLVQGFQNVVDPYFNPWSGLQASPALFGGIRDCNIFLENIHKVVEMDEFERKRWEAEAKFLKAYYHFYLLRMYGPIPLIRENLPISADVEETRVTREPVDDCVNYIVQLLDEAAVDLPDKIQADATELGRITKPIALAIKTRVLIMGASPLFNGNPDYVNFKDRKGIALFNPVYDLEKWKRAADAAKTAIDAAHANGNKLYYYNENNPASTLVSAETNLKMNIRNSLTAKWNPEIVWGNPNNLSSENQKQSQARLDGSTSGLASTGSTLAPTLRMAEMFYTKNGVPITEDNSWDYAGRYSLKTGTAAEKYYIKEGYETVKFHFDREPRFYADLAFDGSIWYGQGNKTDLNNWYVQAKLGQYSGPIQSGQYSTTGYWPQKLVNVENIYTATNNYTIVNYPYPEVRLADLYLLYSEALNEYSGPDTEVYNYIDLVRKRAGLKTVAESWSLYSINKTKHTSKEGLREIIHQERAIELAFEGHRYWDLKRWKEAVSALTYPIQGWNIRQQDAVSFYTVVTIRNRIFNQKDYFWPLRELDMITNKNLVQNPGW